MEPRQILKLRLLADFENSFFNTEEEFIVHKYSNTYFIFYDCFNELDVKCKLLEWLSGPAINGKPYVSEWRNKKFNQFILDGINRFMHTSFTFEQMKLIYEYLGNRIWHSKTIEFIESGYDFEILKQV